MATRLEQAQRGQRKTMLEVYEGCKQNVYYVSLLLTGQEDCTDLDGDYAVFGYVTQGMDVVDAICADAQPTDGNGAIAAEDQPVITSITILTDQ